MDFALLQLAIYKPLQGDHQQAEILLTPNSFVSSPHREQNSRPKTRPFDAVLEKAI
jgi:hypothetical protein